MIGQQRYSIEYLFIFKMEQTNKSLIEFYRRILQDKDRPKLEKEIARKKLLEVLDKNDK